MKIFLMKNNHYSNIDGNMFQSKATVVFTSWAFRSNVKCLKNIILFQFDYCKC